MPLYDYLCPKCQTLLTEFRKIDDRHNGPICCGVKADKQINAAMVTADIQPYKAVAADKESGKCPVINSRKQHREFLRRNGYEELGNTTAEQMMQHPIRKTHPIDVGDAITRHDLIDTENL